MCSLRSVSGLVLAAGMLAVVAVLPAAEAAGTTAEQLESLGGFLRQHCIACHGGAKPESDLDLGGKLSRDAIEAEHGRWREVQRAISSGEMPPRKHPKQPTDADRERAATAIDAILTAAAEARAGDPGNVPPRRLTNAELDYVLNDLTGLDVAWSRELPSDPSGGEGFTNAADTLQMSAALIEQHLAIASRVVGHADLLPGSGPLFLDAEVGGDREELAERTLARLDAFCAARKLPLPSKRLRYLRSAQMMRESDLLASPATKPVLPEVAEAVVAGWPASDQAQWRQLWLDFDYAANTPRAQRLDMLEQVLLAIPYQLGADPLMEASLAVFVDRRRWKPLELRGVDTGNAGGDKNDFHDGLDRLKTGALLDRQTLGPLSGLDQLTTGAVVPFWPTIRPLSAADRRSLVRLSEDNDSYGGYIKVPHAWAHAEVLHRYLDDASLDRLWQMIGDPGSAFSRRFGCKITAEQKEEWRRLGKASSELQRRARAGFREQTVAFTRRAWRGAWGAADQKSLETSFDAAVAAGAAPADAMRVLLVRSLASPRFIYRQEDCPPGVEIAPVTAPELANRLSFFLWSSAPDDELLRAAAAGELSDPDRLRAQLDRMCGDKRILRFAHEFFGQWLGFYRFDRHSRPDRDRFPAFTSDISQAMRNEAVAWCTDLIVNQRRITDLLTANHTYASAELAGFYGLTKPGDGNWAAGSRGDPALKSWLGSQPRHQVADGTRGGLLGWGSVLTKLSQPLRTSPVRRGNWLLVEVLGSSMPAPPANVPMLPDDERNADGLSPREVIARHRADPACASCHARIDPLGLALEQFDPIGRWRTADGNGKPIVIDESTQDDVRLTGIADLRRYMAEEPQRQAFVSVACRKLLGYALGRGLIVSDEPLLKQMREANGGDPTMADLLAIVVASPQFRTVRGQLHPMLR
jgi:hypothetical protein